MRNAARKLAHPLRWIVGISILIFCMTGFAALMGWIPGSSGSSAERTATDSFPEQMTSPIGSPAGKPAGLATKDTVLRTSCPNCGVIESTRVIEAPGKASGLGVVGGAVVGGMLGNQVGGGRGKDILTVVGAVGGAYEGNDIEKRANSSKRYETIVHFGDGTSRVYSAATEPPWQIGDRVKVRNGVIYFHG